MAGLRVAATMDNPFHVEFDPFLSLAVHRRLLQLCHSQAGYAVGRGDDFRRHGQSRDTLVTADLQPKLRLTRFMPFRLTTNGDVYILQRFNPSIRKIDVATGSHIHGGRRCYGIGFSGDGGPATQAQMREPNDCILDGRGGMLIADVQDQRIRRLDIESGVMSTFAGTGEKEHTGDGGKANEAGIFGARAVCVDGRGNTYVCEREGNTLRRIDADGIIATVAGTGAKGYSGDNGPAIDCEFNGPKAIRCDADGNVLIVDTENHAIRKYHADSGIVTTVAGGHEGPDGDGGPAVGAGLARPHGVVVDGDGAMYIADSENHRIRVVR